MVHINGYTKRGKSLIEKYNNSKYYSIWECYSKPSHTKIQAEINCINRMLDTGGRDFRIISYNQMQFTCGWKTPTGQLRVETANNSYIIF